MNGILRITDPILSDDSIDKYKDIEYEPVAGTNLKSSGPDIRLTIETQDIFTHPSESFLIIEGQLIKVDGTLYDAANLITLTNNGIMHLFKRIRYDLSGQEIKNIMNVGQETTMLGLLKYPDDFSKSFSRVYGDTADFRAKFFNMDELVSSPNINPSDYKALYSLFLFDVSKQSEKLKYSTTDIQVKMFFSAGIPLNTQVYGVIISDRLINFQSDGNKFSVVF